MMLPFEGWIKDQEFDDNAIFLFQEAVVCYKNSAYRAALMLSYLAFMTSLRRRILMSETPTGFLPAEWLSDYQNKTRNEETWDKMVFDFNQQKRTGKIVFDISDDIREQIKYWKNRRNDCAHAKDNEIKSSHVEMFWYFLQSAMPKLFVCGGPTHLLNRIRSHFDLSLTPIHADYTGIVTDLSDAVPRSQMFDFFTHAATTIKSLSSGTYDYRHLQFFDKIFQYGSVVVKDELAEFIKSDGHQLEDFIYHYPTRISSLNLTKEYIRSFWRSNNSFVSHKWFKTVLALLRLNLIPADEKDELSDYLLKMSYLMGDISKEEAVLLNDIGFFSKFHKQYISSGSAIGNFNVGNQIAPALIYYLENFDLQLDLVKTICYTLDQSYYPFDLHSAVKRSLSEHPDKLEQFQNIMRTNNIAPPMNSIQ